MTITPEVYRALERARDEVFRAHRDDPNFTGCGIGLRFRGGMRTSEPAVIAMVVNKLPAGAVSRRRLLPTTIQVGGTDYGVDVVESGPVTAATSAAATRPAAAAAGSAPGLPLAEVEVPPKQGCSISTDDGDTGTFGCLVTDVTDGSVCFLSSAHVIADLGDAPLGTTVIQPAAKDATPTSTNPNPVTNPIGTLKRYVPFSYVTDNTVDAAIAQLTDQSNITNAVVYDLMPPIAPDHPAVGMVVATDDQSANCFLCRMDHIVSALNVLLIGATASSPAWVVPAVGENIEKVGRTSGYTSSTIDAVGVIVNVTYTLNNQTSEQTFHDLIWTQAFALAGDSGAVVCIGGNGHTYAAFNPDCPLLSAVESYYALPAGSNANINVLTNDLQGQFLAQSRTGNFLINTVYLNTQVAIDRLQNDQGTAYNQSAAQQFMQNFYTKYYQSITNALADPGSSAILTQQDYSAFNTLVAEVCNPVSQGGEGLLSTGQNLTINSKSYLPSRSGIPEANAFLALYVLLFGEAVGKTRQEWIAAMNSPSVYKLAHEVVHWCRTLEAPEDAAFG